MVAAVILPNAKAAFVTSSGAPAVGYKLKTYDAGTLTPRATYLDAAGVGSNTNPIILDARGEAVIFWDGSYKVILTDPNDVVIWTVDNFSAGPVINSVPWIAAGGTVDAITGAYVPAVTALTDGLILAFRATGGNATTAPTFSPNGLTARTIFKAGGATLLVGDIPRANYECLLRYNLANTRWELLNPAQDPNVLTAVGDAIYTVLISDRVVSLITLLTAPRTLTLPLLSTCRAGQEFVIIDSVAAINGANTITIARGGSDTINGGTTATMAVARNWCLLVADPVRANWTAKVI